MSNPYDYLGHDLALDADNDIGITEDGDLLLVSGIDGLKANLADQIAVPPGDWAYGLQVGSRVLTLVHGRRGPNFGVRVRTYSKEALGVDPRIDSKKVKAKAAWDGGRVGIKCRAGLAESDDTVEITQTLKR